MPYFCPMYSKYSKALLRERMLSLRDSLSAEEREAKGRQIARLLERLREFQEAESILAYASFKSEVPTGDIIHLVLEQGKRVLLPVVEPEGRRLIPVEVRGLEELAPGYAGIPEPRQGARNPALLEEVELILVPGVAFDLQGHRLGYGKGFYDRFLANLKSSLSKIGLAYELQILERLPVRDHDLPMTAVVTEKRVIRPGEENFEGR